MRRTGSRWLDTGGKTAGSMDLMMRRVHSGNSGTPLDRGDMVKAIKAPGEVRSKPPPCADPSYSTLGRTNVLELGAEDEAAFECMEKLLHPLEEDPEFFRPQSAARYSASPHGGSPTGSPPSPPRVSTTFAKSVSAPAAIREGIGADRPPSVMVPERVDEEGEPPADATAHAPVPAAGVGGGTPSRPGSAKVAIASGEPYRHHPVSSRPGSGRPGSGRSSSRPTSRPGSGHREAIDGGAPAVACESIDEYAPRGGGASLPSRVGSASAAHLYSEPLPSGRQVAGVRPSTRRRRRPASSGHGRLADLYLPMQSALVPGGIPSPTYLHTGGFGSRPTTPHSGYGSRPSTAPTTALSAAPTMQADGASRDGASLGASRPATPETRMRSPEKLINFGANFGRDLSAHPRSAASLCDDPRAAAFYGSSRQRPVSRQGLRSAGSMGSAHSGGAHSLWSAPEGAWAEGTVGLRRPHSAASLWTDSQKTARSHAMQRTSQRASSRPPSSFGRAPSVPLIAPVPAPVLETSQVRPGSGALSMSSSYAHSPFGGLGAGLGAGLGGKASREMGVNALAASASVRQMIAGMMLGLQPEHQLVVTRQRVERPPPPATAEAATSAPASVVAPEDATDMLEFKFELKVPTKD